MGACCSKSNDIAPKSGTTNTDMQLPRQPSASILKNSGSVKGSKGRVSVIEGSKTNDGGSSKKRAGIPEEFKSSNAEQNETKSPSSKGDYDSFSTEELQREALSGNIECMYRLAKKYKDAGEDDSSFHWMNRAADRGHLEALYRVGVAYEKGKGVKRNYKKSWESFCKAGDGFHAKSITKMGNFHEKGLIDKASKEEAFRLYKLAAEQREDPDPEAYYYLGLCYSTGTGIEKDAKRAFECFEKAAKARNPRGICNLAFCYENGTGVKKDVREAADLYEEAAALENPTAMYRLGYLHEKGALGDDDVKSAREWYKKAAALGNDDAKKRLERIGASPRGGY
jgi:TPR repeat protein